MVLGLLGSTRTWPPTFELPEALSAIVQGRLLPNLSMPADWLPAKALVGSEGGRPTPLSRESDSRLPLRFVQVLPLELRLQMPPSVPTRYLPPPSEATAW